MSNSDGSDKPKGEPWFVNGPVFTDADSSALKRACNGVVRVSATWAQLWAFGASVWWIGKVAKKAYRWIRPLKDAEVLDLAA